ncbi:hypothetical protein YQE_05677, partial [Dendroctonus ponderosae]
MYENIQSPNYHKAHHILPFIIIHAIVRYMIRTKYVLILMDNAYKVHMKLTIRNVNTADFGAYKCVAKNSLGETDGTIKLYYALSMVFVDI